MVFAYLLRAALVPHHVCLHTPWLYWHVWCGRTAAKPLSATAGCGKTTAEPLCSAYSRDTSVPLMCFPARLVSLSFARQADWLQPWQAAQAVPSPAMLLLLVKPPALCLPDLLAWTLQCAQALPQHRYTTQTNACVRCCRALQCQQHCSARRGAGDCWFWGRPVRLPFSQALEGVVQFQPLQPLGQVAWSALRFTPQLLTWPEAEAGAGGTGCLPHRLPGHHQSAFRVTPAGCSHIRRSVPGRSVSAATDHSIPCVSWPAIRIGAAADAKGHPLTAAGLLEGEPPPPPAACRPNLCFATIVANMLSPLD